MLIWLAALYEYVYIHSNMIVKLWNQNMEYHIEENYLYYVIYSYFGCCSAPLITEHRMSPIFILNIWYKWALGSVTKAVVTLHPSQFLEISGIPEENFF